jgi:hypothetical protein
MAFSGLSLVRMSQRRSGAGKQHYCLTMFGSTDMRSVSRCTCFFFLASEFALLDGHSTGRSLSLERAKLSIEPEIHVFSVTLGSWTEFERSLSIDV